MRTSTRTGLCMALAIAAGLTACGGASPSTIPYDKIDLTAWTNELIATGGVRTNPDMQTVYKVAVGYCHDDLSGLAIATSLSGSRPDQMRVMMKYVCPSRAHLIDDALTENQTAVSNLNQACSTPKQLRTEEQQVLADAAGCS